MNPVERFLKRGNKDGLAPVDIFSKNSEDFENSLSYLKQEYFINPDVKRTVNNTVLFVSNIVYIYLRLKDYENALEWLNKWLLVEPENEEVQLLIKYLDYLVLELAREKRLGIVRTEKFSCFTKVLKSMFFKSPVLVFQTIFDSLMQFLRQIR